MLDWFPKNIATFGKDIDDTIAFIYYLGLAWFILVELVLFYILFTNIKKKGKRSAYIPGNKWSSLKWIFIPTLLIFACDIVIDLKGAAVWQIIKEEIPEDIDVTVKIRAEQFGWFFIYQKNGAFTDSVEIADTLTVPANGKVKFELQSKDVMHSFWVPNLRLKQDAVPGRLINGWFEATEPGTYPVACAEICGFGHTTMSGVLKVLPKEEFNTWYQEQQTAEEAW